MPRDGRIRSSTLQDGFLSKELLGYMLPNSLGKALDCLANIRAPTATRVFVYKQTLIGCWQDVLCFSEEGMLSGECHVMRDFTPRNALCTVS